MTSVMKRDRLEDGLLVTTRVKMENGQGITSEQKYNIDG
jgi:hypothetical protein